MIAEYLGFKSAVESRATVVGKILQSAKHHAMSEVTAILITPFLYNIDINHSEVNVLVGWATAQRGIVISVPGWLFETGAESEVITWVKQCNEKYKEAEATMADKRRDEDIRILHELVNRYPDQVPGREAVEA